MSDAASASARPRHDPLPPSDPVVVPAPSPVDLHAHSTRSDGVLEPAVLLAAAAAAGVRRFGLTDHDTLAGVREVIAADAVPPGLDLIPGVEINAVTDRPGVWEGELHILGFGMDPADEAFEAVMATQRTGRRGRFTRMVDRLAELGMDVRPQLEQMDIRADDALGRPTVARALIAAGHAVSVEDAFTRLIGRGCPAYVPRLGLGPVEAIAAIRAAGGVASLAHFREALARPAIVRDLVAVGLEGIEVHYGSFDRPTTESMIRFAASERLLATGGSDYHGDLGTYAEAHAGLWVPPEVGERLVARLGRG